MGMKKKLDIANQDKLATIINKIYFTDPPNLKAALGNNYYNRAAESFSMILGEWHSGTWYVLVSQRKWQ